MLSRAADSIYWIGRYMERAENVARFIDVNLHHMLDLPPGTPEQWKPLVAVTGDLYRFLERYETTTRESAMQFLAFDAGNPNSILSCLRAARENARSIRDVMSSDMWEHLNATFLHVSDDDAFERVRQAPYDFFSELKLAGRLFEGLTDDTMSHGESWHFCRLGRLIERADKISRIVDEEDARRPHSDARITQKLRAEGIQIARRTVAKYREELRIPSSSQRKQSF